MLSIMSAHDKATRRMRCPSCKIEQDLPVDWKHRPFCSDRCKMVDLGKWLDEKYSISRPAEMEDFEESLS